MDQEKDIAIPEYRIDGVEWPMDKTGTAVNVPAILSQVMNAIQRETENDVVGNLWAMETGKKVSLHFSFVTVTEDVGQGKDESNLATERNKKGTVELSGQAKSSQKKVVARPDTLTIHLQAAHPMMSNDVYDHVKSLVMNSRYFTGMYQFGQCILPVAFITLTVFGIALYITVENVGGTVAKLELLRQKAKESVESSLQAISLQETENNRDYDCFSHSKVGMRACHSCNMPHMEANAPVKKLRFNRGKFCSFACFQNKGRQEYLEERGISNETTVETHAHSLQALAAVGVQILRKCNGEVIAPGVTPDDAFDTNRLLIDTYSKLNLCTAKNFFSCASSMNKQIKRAKVWSEFGKQPKSSSRNVDLGTSLEGVNTSPDERGKKTRPTPFGNLKVARFKTKQVVSLSFLCVFQKWNIRIHMLTSKTCGFLLCECMTGRECCSLHHFNVGSHVGNRDYPLVHSCPY